MSRRRCNRRGGSRGREGVSSEVFVLESQNEAYEADEADDEGEQEEGDPSKLAPGLASV